MATLSIKEEDIPLQSGRKAIITGGASGIGLATAKVLAAKGADVVILDISEPEETLPSTIRFRKCDISQWSDLRDAFADVGVIHIAVANAGQSEDGTYLTDSFDAQGNLLEPNYDVIDVNLRGTLNFVKLALHNMRSNQTKGSIVLTSSATAYLAEQSLPVYSGTKAALANFMRAMRSTLRDSGITINTVAPAATITKLLPADLAAPIIAAGLPREQSAVSSIVPMFSLHALASLIFPLTTSSPKLQWTSDEKISREYSPTNSNSVSRFSAKIHRLEPQISAEVNGFFLEHWPFENDKARKKFIAAGFSRVTCFYYPVALDDRIGFACRLLTLLFLIDDLLEDMSLEDGSAYNERLILLSRGDTQPDRNVPVEWITYDLWNDMRSCDKALAEEILEPVFTFMRAQTDKSRLSIQELGEYLRYRERDVGKALLSALMRFSMKLDLTAEELNTVHDIEMNCSKHIFVVNDIYSWEKELKASQTGHQEGSALCSSVSVLSSETSLDYKASKRVLWTMCREWELVHEELVERRRSLQPCSKDLQSFMKGLEYQMSGNEAWSETTPRYHSV
uniref:Aristolochene synthase n=1 Tax=Colletotrichum fructicola (strain Nara gc5) TaxID=1213859 RepID=L2GBU5_COLFN